MENKKKSHLFVIIMRIVLIFIIVIVAALTVAYQYAKPRIPEIFKNFFNRDLSYDELKISLIDLKINAKNIRLSDGDEELLSAKSIDTKINFRSLLRLELNLEHLYVDSLTTYFEKDGNLFSIPKYIELKKNEAKENNGADSVKKKRISIPVTISEIDIKNSRLELKENKKRTNFITDINIFLPGVNISNKEQKLEPRIQAKIGKKDIDITGTTTINGSRVENNLNLKLASFDISDVSALIPQFNGLKVVGGLITTSSNIKFITDKNRKPIFIIDGSLLFSRVSIYDIKTKQSFLNNLSGDISSLYLSIFGGILKTDSINIKSANINMTISDDEKKNSAIIPTKTTNTKSKSSFSFNFNTTKIKAANINFTLKDLINDQTYKFENTTINTSAVTFPFDNNSINLLLNTATAGAEKIYINADISPKTMNIDIKEIKLSDLTPLYFNIVKKTLPDLKSCYINKLDLAGTISKNKKELSLAADIKDLAYTAKGYNKSLEMKKLDIDIPKISLTEMKLVLKRLDAKNCSVPIDKYGENMLQNLNFTLLQQDFPNEFQIITENNKNILLLKDRVGLNNLSGTFISTATQFDFGLKRILIEPNLKVDILSANFIYGKANVSLEELNLVDRQRVPQFKIKNFNISVDSINTAPFKLIVNTIDIKSDYATTTIKEDGGIYIFSIFQLGGTTNSNNNSANNSKTKIDLTKNVNILSTTINIDRVVLSDLALKENFSLNLSDVNLKLNNFPSTIYPEGDFSIHGTINNRNPIDITGKIRSLSEFNGTLSTKDLMLSQFSPLSKEYINYNITSGTASTETKFSMYQKSFSIDISLTLNHLRMSKIAGTKGKDFSPIIQTMEDANSNIKIDIPIENKDRTKIHIDTKKLFFDLFVNFFNSSGATNPAAIIENIIRGDVAADKFVFNSDNIYEILYFKPGKNEFSRSVEDMLSQSFSAALKNSSKVFLIEGFVDKKRDTPALKNNILEEKLILYNGSLPDKNSEDELDTLKKIYREYYNEDPNELLTNTDIRMSILDKITITDTIYYALSYSRINNIKDTLIDNYNISEDRITSSESNIFENQYINNIPNNIGIITIGTKRK